MAAEYCRFQLAGVCARLGRAQAEVLGFRVVAFRVLGFRLSGFRVQPSLIALVGRCVCLCLLNVRSSSLNLSTGFCRLAIQQSCFLSIRHPAVDRMCFLNVAVLGSTVSLKL